MLPYFYKYLKQKHMKTIESAIVVLTICASFSLSLNACTNKQANKEQSPVQKTEENVSSVPPVTAEQMMIFARAIQETDDTEAAPSYLDKQLKPLGLERIPFDSEGQFFYGLNADIKKIDSGFLYEFKTDDAFIIQVDAYDNIWLEAAFKDKAYLKYYRDAIKKLSFDKVDYLEYTSETYAEVGGHDCFNIDEDSGDGVCTIGFFTKKYEEPSAFSAEEALSILGNDYKDAKEIILNRAYEFAQEDFSDDGEGDAWFTESCKLEPVDDDACDFNIVNTGEEYACYSAIKLSTLSNIVMKVTIELFGIDFETYIEEFVHKGFEVTKSTDGTREFRTKKGAYATTLYGSVKKIDDKHSVVEVEKK